MSLRAAFLLILIAAGVGAFCGARCFGAPVSDPGRDRHIDSSGVVQRMDSNALASADSALARAARDSSVERLKDSAAALGARLDQLDRQFATAQREKRSAKLRADSLTAVVDSMTGNAFPIPSADTMTPTLASASALSCESRYAGRLIQVRQLTDAVERCQAQKMVLQSVLVGVRDTLGATAHYLAASDSLLKWERDRPRPCRVSLLVKSVSCGTAMGGTALIGLVLGIVAAR